jgi:hypothetical protein
MASLPIVDRIARAIDPDSWGFDIETSPHHEAWKVTRRKDRMKSQEAARRVLSTMREPDKEMVDAINHGDAIRELLHARINHDFDAERRALKVLFRSMIDIALRP